MAASSLVRLERRDGGLFFRQIEGVAPYSSADPDTSRVWWHEVGVNQNMTFPVQPDPVSGMHCWHQKVRVAPGTDEDRFGDIFVDPAQSVAVWEEWKQLARPGPGPGGLRRPTWLNRPLRPADSAWRFGG